MGTTTDVAAVLNWLNDPFRHLATPHNRKQAEKLVPNFIVAIHFGTEEEKCLLITSFYSDDAGDFRIPRDTNDFYDAYEWINQQFIRSVDYKYYQALPMLEYKPTKWAVAELNRLHTSGEITVETGHDDELQEPRMVGRGYYTPTGNYGSSFDWKCKEDCQFCKSLN